MTNSQFSKQQYFSDLYQQHQPWLKSWLQKKLGSSDHAADIAHDAWLKLFKQDEMPTHEQSRPYLVNIAKGLMIDRYRRYRVEQAYMQTLQDYEEQYTPSPEQQYLIIETLFQLELGLSQLPKETKQAFLLHRVEGKTYKQIAEILGVSLSSVERYISRALLTCILATRDDR